MFNLVLQVIQTLFSDFTALKPYYFKPKAADIDYNIRYTRNTFISASRAVADYLLSIR